MIAVGGNPSSRDRVLELLSAQADGWLGDEQRDELLDLLRRDPNARAAYAEHAILQSLLHQKSSVAEPSAIHAIVGEADELPLGVDVESEIPRFPLLSLSPLPTPLSSPFVGGPVFSYMVATVVLCVMLLGAWAYKVSRVDHFPVNTAASPIKDGRLAPIIVGRITGMKDCVWSDTNTSAMLGAFVPFDRKYALSSGLLEITYSSSGARVIIEGPCEYTVDSDAGGFLQRGKLVARVEKRVEGREERGEKIVASGQWPVARNGGRRARDEGRESANPKSPIPNPRSLATSHQPLATGASSLPPHPSPLFSVRTPTAVVTDLGTEFGVYVDSSGSCQTYVYQGKVELRITGNGKEGDRVIQLGENESALAQSGENRSVTIIREPDQPISSKFLRRIPKRADISLFNTGVNLNEGDEDRHWQFYARSDNLNFKPRPAVVTEVLEQYSLANNPEQSQWISAVPDLSPLPDNVTYTFRTTFDLNGMSPDSAVIRGRFLADDHVSAIRLNGHGVKVPDHPWGWPFCRWSGFLIREGFVEGINILEVDVLNQDPQTDPDDKAQSEGAMTLRVELWGTAFTTPSSASESETSPAERRTENQKTTGAKTALRNERDSSRGSVGAINASSPIRAEKEVIP